MKVLKKLKDIRIVEASGLKVDNSSLTGESEPQPRAAECTDENPLETRNLAFYSTNVTQGTGKGVVVRIGDETVIGRIAGLAAGTEHMETPLRKEIKNYMRILVGLSTTQALIVLTVGWIFYSFTPTLVLVVGVFVGSIPEGVLVALSVCLKLAATKMAAKNVLVKSLESVETLGSTRQAQKIHHCFAFFFSRIFQCYLLRQDWNVNNEPNDSAAPLVRRNNLQSGHWCSRGGDHLQRRACHL